MAPPATGRNRPTALVIGVDFPGIGIIRSLAREGVPLIIADNDPDHPFMRTRYGRKITLPALHGPELVSALEDLGGDLGEKTVLLATRDDTVQTLSDAAERLEPFFLYPRPDPDMLSRLLTKPGFQEVAEGLDAPLPTARTLEAERDFSALDDLTFPCIVKPAVRTDAYTARFRKAYRVQDRDETEDLCRSMFEVVSPVIVQEWIEGSDADVFFCLQYWSEAGDVVASYSGRKLRSWPVQTGNTASCVPAPEEDAELRALTEDFFHKVGLHGWCAMEYKRDIRNGRFRMVEPTVGRMNAQVESGTLNGTNLPYAGYAALAGLPIPPPERIEPARVWKRDTIVDRKSARHPLGAGPGFPPGLPVVDGVWRWNDPLPGLFEYGGRALARVFGNGAERR